MSEQQVLPQIEFDQETDGRWIAEIPSLPGVMAYGSTKEEAAAKVESLALRVSLAQSEAEGERLQEKNKSLWKEMLSFQHNTATGEWIGSGWTPVQMARVIEESRGIREEITKLTADLARERELNQGLREVVKAMQDNNAMEAER